MKKTIFLVFALAAFMTSCSNSDLAGVATASKGATASITGYLANNYPGTRIFTTTVSGSTVIATLNTGEQLTFSTDGMIMSYANNFSFGLKADSLDIMHDSISNDTFGDQGHGGMGGGLGHGGMGGGNGHDGNGHGHGGPGGNMGGGPGYDGPGGPGYGGPVMDSTHVYGFQKPGHNRHFNNEIVVDSLPTVINAYISANYAGFRVIHAEIDTICQGAITEVMVCTITKEPLKLVFDGAGVYLFKAERILYSEVPVMVTTAITADYSLYTVTHRVEKFSMADGSVQYKMFLNSVKGHKMVTFNANGIVVCEK